MYVWLLDVNVEVTVPQSAVVTVLAELTSVKVSGAAVEKSVTYDKPSEDSDVILLVELGFTAEEAEGDLPEDKTSDEDPDADSVCSIEAVLLVEEV